MPGARKGKKKKERPDGPKLGIGAPENSAPYRVKEYCPHLAEEYRRFKAGSGVADELVRALRTPFKNRALGIKTNVG